MESAEIGTRELEVMEVDEMRENKGKKDEMGKEKVKSGRLRHRFRTQQAVVILVDVQRARDRHIKVAFVLVPELSCVMRAYCRHFPAEFTETTPCTAPLSGFNCDGSTARHCALLTSIRHSIL
ncbi:hypothetical protein niasHT_034265 [Heterodera trifolii]|uniref:Uncharacterized protein n=1 Tax=Heterodera trifolii TaxID=157864 RepID=A0ABD2INF9_9BILA